MLKNIYKREIKFKPSGICRGKFEKIFIKQFNKHEIGKISELIKNNFFDKKKILLLKSYLSKHFYN